MERRENAWLVILPGATRESACMHPLCVLAFSRRAHGAADSAISLWSTLGNHKQDVSIAQSVACNMKGMVMRKES
jgi:hypothetical protein